MWRSSLSLLLFPVVVACEAEPEVVADATEPTAGDNALVIDFGLLHDDSWYAVNDTVMGGVSDGELTYTADSLVFEGAVSTDSNGGFTSVRGPDSDLDLSGYDRMLIRMRSEGQPFSVVLSHNQNWYEGQFRFDIEDASTEWQTLEIALEDLQLYTFSGGYPTPTGISLEDGDLAQIYYVELMSKLFEDGPFRLEVDFIAFD